MGVGRRDELVVTVAHAYSYPPAPPHLPLPSITSFAGRNHIYCYFCPVGSSLMLSVSCAPLREQIDIV